MKIPSILQGVVRSTLSKYSFSATPVLFLLMLFTLPLKVMAEGSVDLVKYPGYRMFLDTRDTQQFKVYAKAGETINVGASHVGLSGGFISLYRPNGTLAVTFDNTGVNTGKAIINNALEELNGPNGGGSTNGPGYDPGFVTVSAGEEGVWTIVFDYPNYVPDSYVNILNSLPWTRVFNQPTTPRAILAWDVTVTAGGAGNAGGVPQKGRLFTQEFITLINGNGFETSPTLYVLTPDGYQYKVAIDKADPFRFPISSNSKGLVNGRKQSIYKSENESRFQRSANPAAWHPDSIYLYEPQANDHNGLVNNKIFFNVPDANMPESALVYDFKSNTTHTTWLYSPLKLLILLDFYFIGVDPGGIGCLPWTLEHMNGGYFYLRTTIPGAATINLDLNNNGIFTDPVDVELNREVSGGIDSIFWNGKDGLGNFLTLNDSLKLNYKAGIRFGELHIAMTDVENLNGGVDFTWFNAPPGYPDSLFYFDHTDIGGPVSGGGTPGNALPTSKAYTYSGEFGNDKYIDQWFFIQYSLDPASATLAVVRDCPCSITTPVGIASPFNGEVCEGQPFALTATNQKSGIGDLTYKWTGPNGFTKTETIGVNDTSKVTISAAAMGNSGAYNLSIESALGCVYNSPPLTLTVNPKPVAAAIVGGGAFCNNTDITLSSANTIAGINTINFTWSGSGGIVASGSTSGTNNISFTLPNVQAAAQGLYTLALTSEKGCVGTPVSTNLIINNRPVISAIPGASGGTFCERSNFSLKATNSTGSVSSMVCTWTGPNGFTTSQTIAGTDTASVSFSGATPALSGVYTLLCVSDGCASELLNFNVNVNPAPVISALSRDSSYCSGTNVLLTASNATAGTGPINYSWTGPAGFSFSGNASESGPFSVTIPAIATSNAGAYSLLLETAGGCKSLESNVNIGVFATPSLGNITGAGSYCLGQTVVLSGTNTVPGTGDLIYSWTGPNGVVSSGTAPGSGPFTATINSLQSNQAGTYTLTVLPVGNSCSSPSASVEVFALPALVISNLTTDKSYCEGSNVVLTATNTVNAGDVTYTWTGPNGFTFTKTVAFNVPMDVTIPEIKPADAGDYVLTAVTAANCNFGPVTVKVGVTPGFYVTSITPVPTVCEGTSVGLTATAIGFATNATYTWTGPCGYTSSGTVPNSANPFSVSVSNIGPNCGGLYTLTVDAAGSCVSAPASVTVAVTPNPVISNITGVNSICPGQSANLVFSNTSVHDSVNYTFTINGVATSGVVRGNSDVKVTVTEAATVTARLETFNGCFSETKTVQVIILPLAKPSVTATASLCQGQTLTLNGTNTEPGSGTVSYTWTGPGGYSFTGSAPWSGPFPATVTNLASGNYCLQITSTGGCVSASACTSVTVLPVAKPSVAATTQFCQGGSLLLTGTNSEPGTGTVSYTWTGPGGFKFTGNAAWAGPFPATVPNAMPGNYCLQITSSSGACISESICTAASYYPKPSFSGAPQGGGAICTNTNTSIVFTVLLNGANSVTYNIKGPGIDSTRTITAQTTVTINIRVGPTTAGTYNITLKSDLGCDGDPVSVTITEKKIAQAVLSVSSTLICQGTTLKLSTNAQTGPNISYEWYKDGQKIGTTSAPTFDVTNANAGKYSVIAFADGCSSTSAEVTVGLIPAPVAVNDAFEGDQANPVKTIVGNVGSNDNSGGRPVTYTVVTNPAKGKVTLDAKGEMVYTPNLGFAGTDQFTYRICLSDCPALCSTATVTIKVVQRECIIPNAITPNGDGVNDQLIILCLVDNAFPNNSIRIFNRWGDEVYFASPYKNDWNGINSKDNKDLPASTYYYIFKRDKNTNETTSGYIRVVR
jgi:gliding motility-associated-like protein